jgi:transposase
MEITTVGLDLAKNIFQVHAIAADGTIVVRRALRRAQLLPFFAKRAPSLVGIEAWPRCAADAASLREALCEAGRGRASTPCRKHGSTVETRPTYLS